MEIYNKVLNYIKKHNLIEKNDKIICAVSGGADSVCMLNLLVEISKEFSLELFVAHLNHQLRGADADRDEAFVKELSKKYNLPFFSKSADAKSLAKELKVSCEEAGRIARYDFFDELKRNLNTQKIATAHNQNDNTETVLMRLFRGTDIKGLSGIPTQNQKSVIRPLLCLKRLEIEEYIRCKGLNFVTDLTNYENLYSRNKIRNSLIPFIENELNQNFTDSFASNIELFGEANDYIENNVNNIYEKIIVKNDGVYIFSIKTLLNENTYIAKRLIKKAVFDLCQSNISNELCSIIYNSVVYSSNTSVTINSELDFYIKYGNAYFVKKKNFSSFSYKITSPGKYYLPEINSTLEITLAEGTVNFSDKNTIYISADKIICDFTVRNRKPGDKIKLLNCGTKKINDIFSDEKIPVFLRDAYPVLEYNGEPIWLCGLRDNQFYRAKTNEKYIKITIHKEQNNE